MNIDEDLENARYVLEKIMDKFRDEPVIPHQNLWQLVKKRLSKAAKLDEILEILETRGFIKRGQMGRKKVINVNPHIYEIQKKSPKSPKSSLVLQPQEVELGEPNFLRGPNSPKGLLNEISTNPELGELGEVREIDGTSSNRRESKSEAHLGELGEHFNENKNDRESEII